ncbi:MAG TPA: GH1 family beta-glucosidase [Myxococcota bacterium]|nr:GH1 family beta-glucosidase [Myxococcota bacterium]
MTRIAFPDDFLWGAATSAYQIEGACEAGGKGESIWDRFCHTPGRIKDGSNGDIACDHYHRFREDIALMKKLCLGAYRFSISWPRIFPQGKGVSNQPGLDFYSNLVDELLQAGIRPCVTLYHWDLPQALQDRGGFSVRDCAGWFGDFANTMVRLLGDRVTFWATLNEPQIFGILGYLIGKHAPGMSDPARYFKACHFINLAHGVGVAAIRAETSRAEVGTVLQFPPIHPVGGSQQDQRAVRVMDGLMNRWYADPVLLGSYPEDMLELFSGLEIPIEEGDLELIHQPLDFIGLNVYSRFFARHDPRVPLLNAMLDERQRLPGSDYTDYGWEVYPEAIYESLVRLKHEYGNPTVYITENGAAYDDPLVDGRIDDRRRIDYLQSYLAQAHRAMQQGVKVKGYFAWSLLDNFEWHEGYRMRFGLVHVDFESLRRTVKESGLFYKKLIESGGFEF